MKSKNDDGTKQPGILLQIAAEAILFIIYSTMRILYAVFFIIWEPFPRYSDWKVCSKPDYQTKHVKEFVAIVLQAAIIYGLTYLLPFWQATAVGVAITNVTVLAVWLIRRL